MTTLDAAGEFVAQPIATQYAAALSGSAPTKPVVGGPLAGIAAGLPAERSNSN